MALPSAYSEEDLKDYLLVVLGSVGDALGWDANTLLLAEVVNDTLLAYGVDAIADASDIPKLRALARWRVWLAAVDALAGYYTVSLPAEGGQLTRSQLTQQATVRLQAAEIEAGRYGSPYALTQTAVTRALDPYR